MSGFFDPPPSPRTNRAAAVTDCPSCQGHRLVPVDEEETVYRRCERCNPAPATTREPVPVDAWWKQ
jgi:hypothetical protein